MYHLKAAAVGLLMIEVFRRHAARPFRPEEKPGKGEASMHLSGVHIFSEFFPTGDQYPFNLDILHQTGHLEFKSPVTFFIGENGSGKSTLLRAITRRCGIHIWEYAAGGRYQLNPYENALHHYLRVKWTNGVTPGSFFAAQIFKDFAGLLDEWASSDPGQLEYFGGKSLMIQSHGESLMSFFQARYKLKGLYILDEPETALSPKTQLKLLKLLKEMGQAGHAQFLIATHSPILLACPEAVIYSFDQAPIQATAYEETEHFKVYRDFMRDPGRYL